MQKIYPVHAPACQLAQWPHELLCLTNARHTGLVKLVEARGTRLLYLSLYSPDYTPIELAFSKLRTHLRSAVARTHEALT